MYCTELTSIGGIPTVTMVAYVFYNLWKKCVFCRKCLQLKISDLQTKNNKLLTDHKCTKKKLASIDAQRFKWKSTLCLNKSHFWAAKYMSWIIAINCLGFNTGTLSHWVNPWWFNTDITRLYGIFTAKKQKTQKKKLKNIFYVKIGDLSIR